MYGKTSTCSSIIFSQLVVGVSWSDGFRACSEGFFDPMIALFPLSNAYLLTPAINSITIATRILIVIPAIGADLAKIDLLFITAVVASTIFGSRFINNQILHVDSATQRGIYYAFLFLSLSLSLGKGREQA